MTNLNTAYAAIPGYQEELDFQQKVRNGFPLEPSRLEDALTAFSDAYRTAIINDAEPPLAEAEAVLEARRHDEILALFTQEHQRIRETNRDRLAQILRDGSSSAFEHLARELDTMRDTIQEHVSNLAGNPTAADVLASGNPTAIAAWQSLGTMADTYDKIRIAQQALLRGDSAFESAYPQPNDVLYSTALYRNTIDVSTYFIKKRQDAAARSTVLSGHTTWLRTTNNAEGLDSHNSWWPDGDRTESLIRIFTQGEPWIPTPATINAAHTTAHRAITPIQAGNGTSGEEYAQRLTAAAQHALNEHRHHTHGEPLDGPHANTGNLSKKHHQIAQKISAEATSLGRSAAYDRERRERSEQWQQARRI